MIVVIDYGMGNLRSVSKALEHLGSDTVVSSDPSVVRKAGKLVLPGVGAFGDAMNELNRLRLTDSIRDAIGKGTPFLGICLGLQLMFESSDECPGIPGLGLYSGSVKLLSTPGVKIPHMGWNSIDIKKDHPLLKGISSGAFFYFVHSYYGESQSHDLVLATCEYGSESFPAVFGTPNTFVTQFHPEKSQAAGLTLLKNFVGWKP